MIPLQDTIRSRSFPVVNWTLILANVAVFLGLLFLGPGAQKAWVNVLALAPARLLRHPLTLWPTLFTSMFLHAGWAHLISNMLALYIFGDNVEDRMGSGRYLVFYLLCGTGAAAVHVAFNASSNVPTVGASGAISGVLAAYFLFFPRARVITLVPLFVLPWLVEIPAVIYLGMWFLSQFLNGVAMVLAGTQALGGVAWWAHVGGFIAGLLLAPLFGWRPYRRSPYPDEYFPW